MHHPCVLWLISQRKIYFMLWNFVTFNKILLATDIPNFRFYGFIVTRSHKTQLKSCKTSKSENCHNFWYSYPNDFKFGQVLDIKWKFKNFSKKIHKNDDVIYNDVIVFWKICSSSAWILSFNFNVTLKTGNYIKDSPFGFQKIKTELKNLALFKFECHFSKGYFFTGQR